MEGTDSSRLAASTGVAARFLANRTSRRSFLTRVGQGSVALAVGSAASGLVAAEAVADGPCNCGLCPSGASCCNFNSTTCLCLTGENKCPDGSCIGGCWWEVVSTSQCGTGIREWCDCVAGCEQSCTCVTCNGGSAARCCRHKTYASRSQCGNGCNHIRCRRHRCISGSFSVSTC